MTARPSIPAIAAAPPKAPATEPMPAAPPDGTSEVVSRLASAIEAWIRSCAARTRRWSIRSR